MNCIPSLSPGCLGFGVQGISGPLPGSEGPLKDQSWRRSGFFGQIGPPDRIFQIPTNDFGLLFHCPSFLFPVSSAFSLSMKTFLLVRFYRSILPEKVLLYLNLDMHLIGILANMARQQSLTL